ncbi:hypothetical protein GCM10020331_020990 [Ectobacillus funiculus]
MLENRQMKAVFLLFLDPVGAGATAYRTQTARKIVSEVQIAALRGNAAEVANVVGENWTIKGVDAGAGAGDVIALAQKAAEQLRTTVVITGKEDVVTDGAKKTYIVRNGHPILTKVTGTGCLLTSVIGAFAAVEKDIAEAAVAALVSYEVAAEVAAKKKTVEEGPGSFQIELLNQLSKVSAADAAQYGSVEKNRGVGDKKNENI